MWVFGKSFDQSIRFVRRSIPMFRNGVRAVLWVLLVAAALESTVALGADPPPMTTIQVRDMCCNGCARKIAARLYEVRGVTAVRCDVQKKIVYVTPQRGAVLSPLALWQAVEKAPDQPLRLAGPSGVFTVKPAF
jgi:copper chaperone CopZ